MERELALSPCLASWEEGVPCWYIDRGRNFPGAVPGVEPSCTDVATFGGIGASLELRLLSSTSDSEGSGSILERVLYLCCPG